MCSCLHSCLCAPPGSRAPQCDRELIEVAADLRPFTSYADRELLVVPAVQGLEAPLLLVSPL